MKTRPRHLTLVKTTPRLGTPLETWLRTNTLQQLDNLPSIIEINESLNVAIVGMEGICVLGTHNGRPIFEFGTASRARLTVVGFTSNIWSASVVTPHNVTLESAMLFHTMAMPAPNCGLPFNRMFGPYCESRRRFSLWTYSTAKLINVAYQIGLQMRR